MKLIKKNTKEVINYVYENRKSADCEGSNTAVAEYMFNVLKIKVDSKNKNNVLFYVGDFLVDTGDLAEYSETAEDKNAEITSNMFDAMIDNPSLFYSCIYGLCSDVDINDDVEFICDLFYDIFEELKKLSNEARRSYK